jgi:hypothetical protein
LVLRDGSDEKCFLRLVLKDEMDEKCFLRLDEMVYLE